ncbi:hypothetical protein MNBD_ALPHA03-1413, partial [hydrothermal vent metagenome]
RSSATSLWFERTSLIKLDCEDMFVQFGVKLEEVWSSEESGKETGLEEIEGWQGGRGPNCDAYREIQKVKTPPGAIAFKSEQGICEIKMAGADIAGSLVIKSSLLVAPKLRTGIDTNNERLNYALNTAGSKIGGSIQLMENTAVLGGVNLAGANVTGDVFMAGAKLVGGEGAAFNGQLMIVGGFVGLRAKKNERGEIERFEAQGVINMLNASVVSTIDLTGGLFEAGTATEEAINIINMPRLGKVTAGKLQTETESICTTVVGILNLVGCVIEGDVYLADVDVYHRQDPTAGVEGAAKTIRQEKLVGLNACNIHGRLIISGTLRAGIDLSETHVTRAVFLGNGSLSPLHFICPPKNITVLDLDGARLESTLVVSNLQVETPTGLDRLKKSLTSKDVVDMRSCDLSFAPGSVLHELKLQGERRTFFATVIENQSGMHVLDGQGPAIIKAFSRTKMDFSDEEKQKEYLRLFCNNLSSDWGPFKIVEPGGWLCSILPDACKEAIEPFVIASPEAVEIPEPEKYLAAAKATIWYGSGLYHARLAIHKSLTVEMLSDKPRYMGLPVQVAQVKPLKYLDRQAVAFSKEWPLFPCIAASPQIHTLEASKRKAILRSARKLSDDYKTRPVVSMQNAHIHEINDNDGNAWSEKLRLKLTGLTYDALRIGDQGDEVRSEQSKLHFLLSKNPIAFRIGKIFGFVIVVGMFYAGWLLLSKIWQVTYGGWILLAIAAMLIWANRRIQANMKPKKKGVRPWRSRQRWLRLQYETTRPTKKEFNPQPLEQLAGVFRRQGQEEDFRRISRLKLFWKNQSVTAPIWRPFAMVFRVCFGYGFSASRAVATFLLLLAFGVWGTNFALKSEVLVLSTSPDSLVLAAARETVPDVQCGKEIVPFLFALDTFMPLIDLGQESRCRVRSETEFNILSLSFLDMNKAWETGGNSLILGVDNWASGMSKNLVVWHFVKAIYKLLGWIVISLLILTITNSIRRTTGD